MYPRLFWGFAVIFPRGIHMLGALPVTTDLGGENPLGAFAFILGASQTPQETMFYLPGSKNGYKNLKQSQVRRVKKDSLVLVHACITFEVLSSASLKLFISKNIFPRKTLDMDLKMHQFDTLPLRKVCANFLLLREKGDQIFLH